MIKMSDMKHSARIHAYIHIHSDTLLITHKQKYIWHIDVYVIKYSKKLWGIKIEELKIYLIIFF